MLSFAFALLLTLQEPGNLQVHFNEQKCIPEQHTCVLTGDVVVTYEEVRVEANALTVNTETYDVTSPPEEHVKFTRPDEQLDGTDLALNIKTKAGTMKNADGHVRDYYFKAAEMQRFDDGRYLLHDAVVTTCDKPSPGWSMQSHRAYVIPGETMTATGSIFRVQGLPVFYLPYVAMPSIDRERQTGFLIPSTSTSTTKGRSVHEEFYWAINRSADALFTGEYFTSRGPAGQFTFRAVPNKNSRLEISSFFVKDRLGQGGNSARILNYTDFGHGYRGVADMNLVSSFLFRQVFEDGLSLISSPIEHSVAYLTRNQTNLSYNFLYNRTGIFFQDQPTVVTSNGPAFEAGIPEKQLGSLPAYFVLDGGASGISRRNAAIDTNGMVGRFDFHPVLEVPAIRTSALEWSHEIGARDTYYSATIQNTSTGTEAVTGAAYNRFVLDYRSKLQAPTLERDYGSWRHVIEPSVSYHYVNGANRFRDTVVVDNVDLLTNTNEVEYGVTNRIFTKREIFSWKLAQEYFLDPSFGGAIQPGVRNAFDPVLDLTGFAFADGRRKFSPIVSKMRLSTSPNTSTDLQVDYDTERHRFDGVGISGGVNRGQASGNIAYFFRSSSDIQFPSDQFRGNFVYGNELKSGFSFALSAAYDVQHRVFQQSTTQVGYNWDCYGVSVDWMQFNLGARIESRIRFAFSLKNIGTFGNLRRQDRIF
jgi:LPS-assembly protein